MKHNSFREIPQAEFEKLFDKAWKKWFAHNRNYKQAIFLGDNEQIQRLEYEQVLFAKTLREICDEMRRRKNE